MDSKGLSDIVRIDSRVMGFSDKPARILAACFRDTGEIRIERYDVLLDFNIEVLPEYRDDTVIVTDAPEIIQNWSMSFNARDDFEEVVEAFQFARQSGKIEIENKCKKFNPSNVLQLKKIDEKGQKQEFDSSLINNGHLAILLAVWVSQKIAMTHSSIFATLEEGEYVDTTLLPRSF